MEGKMSDEHKAKSPNKKSKEHGPFIRERFFARSISSP
jgi:hypothetical protein